MVNPNEAPQFIEPPGPKVTYTIEIWPASGHVKTHSTPEQVDPLLIVDSMLSLSKNIIDQIRQQTAMLVGRNKEQGQ